MWEKGGLVVGHIIKLLFGLKGLPKPNYEIEFDDNSELKKIPFKFNILS